MNEIRVTTQNLDWGLNSPKWNSIIVKLQAESDVILFQEAKNIDLHKYADDVWAVFQDEGTPGKRGTAIMWRKSVGIRHGAGLEPYVPSVRGVAMPDRYIAWVNLWIPAWSKHVVFGSMHYPPLRFKARWPVATKSFTKFVHKLRSEKLAFVVGSDFNSKVTNDVHGIRRKLGLFITGHRIDGFAVAKRLSASKAKNLGNDASDHDPLQILVRPKVRRQKLPSRN